MGPGCPGRWCVAADALGQVVTALDDVTMDLIGGVG